MTEPAPSPEDAEILIAYARRKFAEERWPLATSLRPIREALERLQPKPKPEQPRPAPRPYVPSTLARRKHR
jgi:hypothetical protein